MKGSKNVTCQSDGTLSGIPICVSISGEWIEIGQLMIKRLMSW
jgi:hypothetical protein